MNNEQILVDLYRQAQIDIINRINKGLSIKDDPAYFKTVLKSITQILQKLKADSNDEIDKAIDAIYKDALSRADEHFIKFNDAPDRYSGSFGQIHQQAVKVLASDLKERLNAQIDSVYRNSKYLFDNLRLESIRGSVIGYETWQESSKKMIESLQKRGITSFTDRLGRKWNLETYSEMAIRTGLMETMNQGTCNRILERGNDLIRISSHRGACPRCAPWQGKILSITGKTSGFPTLGDAKAAGLFHPRCRHAISAAFVDLEED